MENSVTEYAGSPKSGQADKRKGYILIIDQDDSTRDFLSSIIKLIGCEFKLVRSVEQAMELLEKTHLIY